MKNLFFLLGSGEFVSKTHYPVRLNRRTRLVHAFRGNGSILSVPWDEVYFTLRRIKGGGLQDTFIFGHVLAPDGRTVKDSFILGSRFGDGTLDTLSSWEFFRRYMEEGLPQALEGAEHVICFPMDRGRESLSGAWASLKFGITGPYSDQSIHVYVLLPPVLFILIFRMIIMQINRLPVWPQEIEATCAIRPDDPHVYDVTTNPPGMRFGY
nr:DUF6708 domain-containing protein [uncultured Holophaga sp.]